MEHKAWRQQTGLEQGSHEHQQYRDEVNIEKSVFVPLILYVVYNTCSSSVYYCCDEIPWQFKDKGVFYAYSLTSRFIKVRSQSRTSNSRKLEAGTDAKSLEECCLLTCFLSLLIASKTNSPKLVPLTMDSALPEQLLGKSPTDRPTPWSYGGNFSLKFYSLS